MRDGALEISDIVPEVRGIAPDNADERLGEGPEQARFRLFDAVSSFFCEGFDAPTSPHRSRQPALGAPLITPPAQLPRDLYRRPANSHRRHVPQRRHHARTSAHQRPRRPQPSRPFRSADPARSNLEATLPTTLPRPAASTRTGRLAELIHLHTEGNAFFVTELVRLLYQEGVLHGNAGEAEDPSP